MNFDFQDIELEQTTDNYNIAGILRAKFREHLKARYNMLSDDMLDYLCETHIYMNRPASSSMKKLKLDKVQVLVFDVTPHRPVDGIDGTDQPLTTGDVQTLFEELRACYDGYKFKPTTLYIEIRSTGKNGDENPVYKAISGIWNYDLCGFTKHGISPLTGMLNDGHIKKENDQTDFNVIPEELVEYYFFCNNIFMTKPAWHRDAAESEHPYCSHDGISISSQLNLTLTEKGKENFIRFMKWSEKCRAFAIQFQYTAFKHLFEQLPEYIEGFGNRDIFLKMFTYTTMRGLHTSLKEMNESTKFVSLGSTIKETRAILENTNLV